MPPPAARRPVYAAAASVGAGLAANTDRVTHHCEIDASAASAAVTVPVALFLAAVALLHRRPHHAGQVRTALAAPATAAVLAVTFSPVPVLATLFVLTALIVITEAAGGTRAAAVTRGGPGKTYP